MEGSAYLAELVAGVILFMIGVRLLRLALRTGGRPEWLLGTYLGLSGVSYILYQIPLMLDVGSLELTLTFAGRVIYGVAVYFILAFTRTVFRNDERWSRWLLYGLMASLILGISMSAVTGNWEGYSISDPGFWFEWLGYTLATAWVCIEALLAYRSARKRSRLGLCEPLIVNRYLLWSLFGIFQFVSAAIVLPMYIDYAVNQRFSALPDLMLGIFETLAAVAGWFVFFAPTAYRNWIQRSAAPVPTMDGT